MKKRTIHLFYPYVPKEAVKAVTKTLNSRWIGQGPQVDQFEKDFEKKFKVKYAVSLNSGTSALETAFDLIDLKKGDSVISTPLTCTATNLGLIRRGVKIIWADILESTLNINPIDVRSKITKKTKAVIQVHIGGIKADVGKLHIPVISDAAQALGIFVGNYTCCSFQSIKHITTIDGGMIVLNNKEEYKKAKLLRWFGIDREKKSAANYQCYKKRKMTFDIELAGTKRHMHDISAAMGIIGLKHYDEMLAYRKKLFDLYKDELKNVDGIKFIDGQENKCWLCTILVERRENFSKMMFKNGIDVNMVHLRNDLYKIFGGKRQDLPIMNKVEEKYISIPIGRHVSEEDALYIVDNIKKGWG